MTRDEFAPVIAYLNDSVTDERKAMTKGNINVYFDALSDLPIQVVMSACRQAVLTNEFPVIPPIGLIRRLATEAMTPPAMTADQAWVMAVQAVRTWGLSHQREGLNSLPPAIAEAVRRFTWSRLCDSSGDSTDRAQWRDNYKPIASQEKTQASLPAKLREQLSCTGTMPRLDGKG